MIWLINGARTGSTGGLGAALALLLSFASCRLAPGALSDFQAFTHVDSQGRVLPYRFFTPLNYDPGRQYPLILMLHGAGEAGTDNIAPASHISSTRIVDRAKTDQYASFVLVPQSSTALWFDFSSPDLYWTEQDTMNVLNGLEQRLSIDRAREYVTGLSNGGIGVWDLIAKRPNRFAAAAPVSGGGDPSTADIIKDIPIWAYHGTLDPIIPVNDTRSMIDALRAAGGNPRYTEFPFDGHDDTMWNDVYSEPQLYQWMFQQVNPNVPPESVPEPAGIAIIAAGAMLGLARRRSRRCNRAARAVCAISAVMVSGIWSGSASANLLVDEPFDYPAGSALDGVDGASFSVPGQLAPNGNAWFAAGSGTQITYDALVGTVVTDDDLAITGLAPARGNAVVFGGAGYDARLAIGQRISSGAVYASFALRIFDITGLSANGGLVAGFNNTAGTQSNLPFSIDSSVWVRPTPDTTDDPRNYNFGLNKTSSTSGIIWDSGVYVSTADADPHLLVTSYTFAPGGANDVSHLYLDPPPATFGGATPVSGTILSTAAGSDIPSWVYTFLLRQSTASATPEGIELDELRVGTSYADVTPVPEPGGLSLVLILGLRWTFVISRSRPFGSRASAWSNLGLRIPQLYD